jgi:hypothetical protein
VTLASTSSVGAVQFVHRTAHGDGGGGGREGNGSSYSGDGAGTDGTAAAGSGRRGSEVDDILPRPVLDGLISVAGAYTHPLFGSTYALCVGQGVHAWVV